MASSRRQLGAVVAILACAATLTACELYLGLNQYSYEDCGPSGDCDGGGAGEVDSNGFDTGLPFLDSTTMDTGADVTEEPDAGEMDSTTTDATSDVTFVDAPPDAPELVTLWAQWPMPNPDAPTVPDGSIAPDSGTLLPNQMSYDAGADGGASTVFDAVTGLTWYTSPGDGSTIVKAANYCSGLGQNVVVPTRIQLVSLIDFTRLNPTIDTTVFTQVNGDRYITSSRVEPQGTSYWTVDFSSGLVSNASTPGKVLCVKGGP